MQFSQYWSYTLEERRSFLVIPPQFAKTNTKKSQVYSIGVCIPAAGDRNTYICTVRIFWFSFQFLGARPSESDKDVTVCPPPHFFIYLFFLKKRSKWECQCLVLWETCLLCVSGLWPAQEEDFFRHTSGHTPQSPFSFQRAKSLCVLEFSRLRVWGGVKEMKGLLLQRFGTAAPQAAEIAFCNCRNTDMQLERKKEIFFISTLKQTKPLPPGSTPPHGPSSQRRQRQPCAEMKIVWAGVEYSILTWSAQSTGSIYPCWPAVTCCSICGCLQCKGTNVLFLWAHSGPRLDILISGLSLEKILMDWGIVVLECGKKSWHLCIYSECFSLMKSGLLPPCLCVALRRRASTYSNQCKFHQWALKSLKMSTRFWFRFWVILVSSWHFNKK